MSRQPLLITKTAFNRLRLAGASSNGLTTGCDYNQASYNQLGNNFSSLSLSRRQVTGQSSDATAFLQLPSYESVHSLKRIYPKSSLSISATDKISSIKNETGERFSGYIPMEKLQFAFARSQGPGGQNVNKVNSKVTLSFHLESADWIPLTTRAKLAVIHKNSITKEGSWVIRSDKTRTQFLNVADCIDKLRCYIAEAEMPPKQPSIETLEKKKAAAEKAAALRLRNKRHASMLRRMKQD